MTRMVTYISSTPPRCSHLSLLRKIAYTDSTVQWAPFQGQGVHNPARDLDEELRQVSQSVASSISDMRRKHGKAAIDPFLRATSARTAGQNTSHYFPRNDSSEFTPRAMEAQRRRESREMFWNRVMMLLGTTEVRLTCISSGILPS